jgi:hypothetical protein
MVLAVIAAADQRFGWRDGVGIAGLGSLWEDDVIA